MTSAIEAAFRQLLQAVVEEGAEKLIREREVHEYASRPQASYLGNQLLIDSAETAKRLGISLATLERRTRSGEIPCIKLGRLVRYSTETLQQWIRESEADKRSDAEKATMAASRHDTAVESPNARRAGNPSPASREPASSASPRAESNVRRKRTQSRQVGPSRPQDEKPLNPFDKLLQELGVKRSDLPPLTNGELMRIAEVDTPTLHGWMYLNRELPESAVKKLCDHFAAYRRAWSEIPLVPVSYGCQTSDGNRELWQLTNRDRQKQQ